MVDETGIASIGFNATGTVARAKGAAFQFGFNAYDANQQSLSLIHIYPRGC